MTADAPAGTMARKLFERLLIDLSWNSSRLEGNTYSLLETEALIVDGQEAEGKATFEAQIIINYKAAIGFLVNNINHLEFNRYTILNLHAFLSENLLPNPEACGRLRSISANNGRSVYTPTGIPQVIESQFTKMLNKVSAIKDPFEQAFFILVQRPYLQPFEDVNKRVSRLSANIPFIKYNLSPLSFVDVEPKDYIDGVIGVYEKQRTELLQEAFFFGI